MSDIKRGRQYIDIYKTIIERTFGKGMKGERLPELRVIGPNEIYTGSLISLCKSKDVSYCQNIDKYVQTKFVALLVGLRKSTHNATRAAYKFVPMQDFTSNSDIDWSKPISDIDQQLYHKYKLTDEEIAYIEKTIKPMN